MDPEGSETYRPGCPVPRCELGRDHAPLPHGPTVHTLEGYPFGYDSDPLSDALWPHGTHLGLTVQVQGDRILSARCTSCGQSWTAKIDGTSSPPPSLTS